MFLWGCLILELSGCHGVDCIGVVYGFLGFLEWCHTMSKGSESACNSVIILSFTVSEGQLFWLSMACIKGGIHCNSGKSAWLH